MVVLQHRSQFEEWQQYLYQELARIAARGPHEHDIMESILCERSEALIAAMKLLTPQVEHDTASTTTATEPTLAEPPIEQLSPEQQEIEAERRRELRYRAGEDAFKLILHSVAPRFLKGVPKTYERGTNILEEWKRLESNIKEDSGLLGLRRLKKCLSSSFLRSSKPSSETG